MRGAIFTTDFKTMVTDDVERRVGDGKGTAASRMEPARVLDTSRIIEIESSPAKLLAIVAAGLLLTAGGAALAFGGFSGRGATAYAHGVGFVMLVFFGACTVVALWRFFTARGPVITISPQGIRDIRVAADVIPWGAITGISTWEFRRQKIMVLAVTPAAEAKLMLTPIARWTRGANRAVGADGLGIAAQGLKIDYDTLLATVAAYAQADRLRAQSRAH